MPITCQLTNLAHYIPRPTPWMCIYCAVKSQFSFWVGISNTDKCRKDIRYKLNSNAWFLTISSQGKTNTQMVYCTMQFSVYIVHSLSWEVRNILDRNGNSLNIYPHQIVTYICGYCRSHSYWKVSKKNGPLPQTAYGKYYGSRKSLIVQTLHTPVQVFGDYIW